MHAVCPIESPFRSAELLSCFRTCSVEVRRQIPVKIEKRHFWLERDGRETGFTADREEYLERIQPDVGPCEPDAKLVCNGTRNSVVFELSALRGTLADDFEGAPG
ncbi:hypothetical protein PG997_011825 [Apiospora hydei]|uniref:Uncharacterized protein n=1 Tax=Apiospora hydei TaxID=1337664 RepID=A0ABR1V1P7_9PEZI